MKIALLSKFPPIEGQVSTVNYWLARGLAERGHEVVVVTNAGEVETSCRLWGEESQPSPDVSQTDDDAGRVVVLQTAAFGHSQFHIPWSNPFATKLAALTLKAIRERKCELIFTHYLEPYALAGHLAASWTNTPHVVTHSGSDIGRLLKNPDLAPSYLEIIKRATLFVPKNRQAGELTGTSLAGFSPPSPYAPPEKLFNPGACLLDVNSLLSRARQYIHDELKWHTNEYDPGPPTFGVYGKLFEVKGIYDLLTALAKLRGEGFAFNLLLMTRWRRGEDGLRASIIDAGLESRTWWLPFLPNWEIPSFIRSCVAVCYLERKWPMPFHTSIVPREVMACGKCLVISDEARSGNWYRDRLIDSQTCLSVADPSDVDVLTGRLRLVLENPEAIASIGHNAYLASLQMSTHEQFVTSWENLFSVCLSRKDTL
jgi:glycosyltransferase involved in cell wall biosynthesis